MASIQSNPKKLRSTTLLASVLAATMPWLAGCGGGELLAPDTTAMQTEQDLAAFRRATALNQRALSPRVKGERPTGAAAQ